MKDPIIFNDLIMIDIFFQMHMCNSGMSSSSSCIKLLSMWSQIQLSNSGYSLYSQKETVTSRDDSNP